MAKSMGHFRDSRALSWLSAARTDALGEPPLKGIIILFSQPIIKWKANSTLSEKLQKFNRKIVEIGKFDIPNTHIHDRSLS
jgi:hypothetical protein